MLPNPAIPPHEQLDPNHIEQFPPVESTPEKISSLLDSKEPAQQIQVAANEVAATNVADERTQEPPVEAKEPTDDKITLGARKEEITFLGGVVAHDAKPN